MTAGARPLTAAQRAQAQDIQSRLSGGEAHLALPLARQLALAAPQAPDAHQLLAVVAARSGEPALAEQAFGAALALAPGHAGLLCNRAVFLRSAGRPRDARADLLQALAREPALLPAWTTRAEIALELGELDEARACWQRVVELAPGRAEGWRSLAYTWRQLGELAQAEQAWVRAVDLEPAHAASWLNLGATLRLRGRPDDALRCYARAAELGLAGPELLDAACGALVDRGDPLQALALAERLVAEHPHFAPGHATLADLRWEHRDAALEDPLAPLVAAAAARPDDEALHRLCADRLLRAGRAAEALALVERHAAPGLGLRQVLADALLALQRGAEAEAAYEQLLRDAGADAPNSLLNAAAAAMLRRGRAQDAERLCARAVGRDPRDQLAWAYRGTAWRVLGDARADWLWDVDRLVTQHAVDPDGLPQLRQALEPLHRARGAPLTQTLRGGSQTPGMLFGRPEAPIRRFAEQAERSIVAWLRGLTPDASHPVRALKRDGIRFVGSWSVRLQRSGHHVHHIHGEGWYSSAYHLSLPSSVRQGSGGDAGCLVLGVPPAELGLDLPPLRTVRPREAHLVLFPSCLWHGTVPFDDDEPRLTLAFDVQPRG